MAQKQQINVKLDQVKDQDIIQFLDGKPVSWAVREALRQYMRAEGFTPAPEAETRVINTVEPKPVVKTTRPAPAPSEDEDDPFAPVD